MSLRVLKSLSLSSPSSSSFNSSTTLRNKKATPISFHVHSSTNRSWYGVGGAQQTSSVWKPPSTCSNSSWYGVDESKRGNGPSRSRIIAEFSPASSTAFRSTSPAMFSVTRSGNSSIDEERAPFFRFSPLLGTNENKALVDSMIRVDHSGEYAAQKIYEGQLFVLGRSDCAPVIQEMKEQEEHHLRVFEDLIVRYRARPSLLLPLWHVAGFTLGAATSLLGKEGAMACTVAVETVITDHYNDQLRVMHERQMTTEEYAELRETIKRFRDDEENHHNIGLKHEAEKAPFYSLLNTIIQSGCRAAIWIASRI